MFKDDAEALHERGTEALHRHENDVAEKLLMYATGRGLEYYDRPAIRSIAREAAADDYKLGSVILGVIKSTPFQMRRWESAASDVVASR